MKNLISIGMQNTLTYHYPLHHHNHWEITYYTEGSGTNVTNGVEYEFGNGTIICQPPFLGHKDVSPNGYKNIYFLIKEFEIYELVPIITKDNENGDFLYILKQLYSEYYFENNAEILNALLQLLYLYMQQRIRIKVSNPYVDKIKREITDNFSNHSFSILDAVADLPVSVNHFRRIFEKETGMSPQQYLQNIRIEYAKKLLENSTIQIKNICVLCGYNDPYYFSRIFKKYCGENPRMWRNSKSKL